MTRSGTSLSHPDKRDVSSAHTLQSPTTEDTMMETDGMLMLDGRFVTVVFADEMTVIDLGAVSHMVRAKEDGAGRVVYFHVNSDDGAVKIRMPPDMKFGDLVSEWRKARGGAE